MLYEMDTKMFIMKKTMQDIIMVINFFDMSLTYWPTFKPEFLGYTHHSMLLREMLTFCMNI